MTTNASFAVLLEKFFTERLMKQKRASSHTIRSYRDTFRLLLRFFQKKLKKAPSKVELSDINADLIAEFLETMEKEREISARSRNLRLTAIRSFFRYAALEAPDHSGQIQRVLSIPSKRYERTLVHFLTQQEVLALLAAPDRRTWIGRRDHALLLVAVHTGLRLSELTALRWNDVVFGTGAHVRVIGKGRKERCTPLTKQTATVLRAWLSEQESSGTEILFPNARGKALSNDGVQYLLTKHVSTAGRTCASILQKRVTPHVLRHTLAMELLQSGLDRAMIALWLGHECLESTQVYLHANLALKEKILAKASLPKGKTGRYRPDDKLMDFLSNI